MEKLLLVQLNDSISFYFISKLSDYNSLITVKLINITYLIVMIDKNIFYFIWKNVTFYLFGII